LRDHVDQGVIGALSTACLAASWLALVSVAGAQTPPEWRGKLHAETDARTYVVGDASAGLQGVAVLHNDTNLPVYLPGCSQIELDRMVGQGQWAGMGAPIMCVWEGVAVRVEAGATFPAAIALPEETGIWRVRFVDVRIGCADGQPMSSANCTGGGGHVATLPFKIRRSVPAEPVN
jgi:hypothetical protein